jgi:hypothetical protein
LLIVDSPNRRDQSLCVERRSAVLGEAAEFGFQLGVAYRACSRSTRLGDMALEPTVICRLHADECSLDRNIRILFDRNLPFGRFSLTGVARRKEEDALIVVVARFPMRCEGERDWDGTEIDWPHGVEGDAVWRDLFTGRAIERHRETFDVRTVLEDMPVAVLVPENGG